MFGEKDFNTLLKSQHNTNKIQEYSSYAKGRVNNESKRGNSPIYLNKKTKEFGIFKESSS